MGLSYPTINGQRQDFSSVVLTIGTQNFIGLKDISYDQETRPGEIRGTTPQIIGRTRGKYTPTGSMTLYLAEYHDLLDFLGPGYMVNAFEAIVSYQESGDLPLLTDHLEGCRLMKISKSHSEGEEALVVKCDLHIIKITESGSSGVELPALDNMLL